MIALNDRTRLTVLPNIRYLRARVFNPCIFNFGVICLPTLRKGDIMRKTAIFLCVVMMFSIFSITSFAQNTIPVSAEVSETSEGDLRVVVYVQNVEKLISLNAVLEYDTSVYNLKSAKASTSADSYGEESDNISGLWVFGNLTDGSGCVGAFVAFGGITKKAKTAACEFILESQNGEFNIDEIDLSIKELITEDNNEENDIYEKVRIPFKESTVDLSGVFGYEIQGETVNITEFKTNDDVIFIPRYIEGLTVRSVNLKNIAENPFVVFDRNVLNVGDNVFLSDSTVIAPFRSAPTAAVTKAGGKYLGYYENITPDLSEKVLYTDQYLVNDSNMIFSCTADFSVQPSHNTFKNYLGTGTVITLKSGEKFTEFLLCVKGDINGDSVCDVLDTVFAELYVNDLYELESIQKKSADFDGDNKVTAQDYTQLVNLALDSEYKIFDGIRGDLNGDYAIDTLDIFVFNRKISDKSISAEEKAKIDFDNNGVLNSTDRDILNELVMTFI